MPTLCFPRRLTFIVLLLAIVGLHSPLLAAEEPRLLNIKDVAPAVIVDMRYATADNFTGRVLYPAAECLLCEPAARRLAAVQKNLAARGLGLKVWDCYRPLSVQKKLWDVVPDPRYVADPRTGSRHNRGASVDLTLVDSAGHELLMPTPFDEFSEKAHRSYMNLSPEAIKNRRILQDAMESEGFIGLPTEWWHFDDPSWSHFALRDEPLTAPTLKKDLSSTEPAGVISADTRQLVVVTSRHWADPTGELQRWEKRTDGWHRVGEPWPVSLGSKGMAWGRGRQPDMTAKGSKQEGDLTAPAGVFRLGDAYGYAHSAPAHVRWPYHAVGPNWVCVDDPRSSRYNEIFDSSGVVKDWRTAEIMRRQDPLYSWLINVEQNTPSTCGCGSCVFLHVWRRPNAPTEGCTAMDEKNILELLRWLDPAAHPALVQLPDEAYGQYRDEWALP